jgi:hypothetical protein
VVHRLCSVASAVFVAALVGCVGNATNGPSPAQPAAFQSTAFSSQAAAHNGGTPNSCPLRLYIVPETATIHVNQHLTLSAYREMQFQNLCPHFPTAPQWGTTGGHLRVSKSGKQAHFSASTTGKYTIAATERFGWHFLKGTSSITVVP